MPYLHGAYGEFDESISTIGIQSTTIPVYVGTLPVNLIRGYESAVNLPIMISDFTGAKEKVGYSSDWETFSLCEAIKLHFNNAAGNAGPIVVINVLDPATHKKAEQTTTALTFTDGRATIASDKIVLDTLVLEDKVEGTDFSVTYDFDNAQVVINSIGEETITGQVNATYSEIDTTNLDKDDIIGGISDAGVYTGLGAVALVYQELNLIPNLILAPGWSDTPEVYQAMIQSGQKINGHWFAFVLADLSLTNVNTIDKAIEWAEENKYNSEFSKTYWPQFITNDGEIYHGSTLAAWQMLQVDAEHDGVPMETPSNKPIPIAKQYFGTSSTNRGFDQQQANKLNANGISSAVYWGGQWVLWGGHTAAYNYDTAQLAKMGAGKFDKRVTFDNNIRMMMHILNDFQREWSPTIDEPMTRALIDTIRNREQEKLDAYVAIGALIGTPVVEFRESENSESEIADGNFVWNFEGTPTPQWKSGILKAAYTDAGFSTYFEEEA